MAGGMLKQIELAKKYFYLMMFEYQHKIPLQSSSRINSFGYEGMVILKV